MWMTKKHEECWINFWDFFFKFAANTELVLINFYADWCRFSNMLAPIFDEAADKVAAEFPEKGRVVLGKVDCDKDSEYLFIASLIIKT